MSMVKVDPAGLPSMCVGGVSTKRAWQDVPGLDTILPVSSLHQMTSAPTLSSCTMYGPIHSPDFEGRLVLDATIARDAMTI